MALSSPTDALQPDSAEHERANDGARRNWAGNRVVVAIGALGIVTRITLRVQPAFQVRPQVCEHLPLRR